MRVTGESEKFSPPELAALQDELLRGGLDSRQAGELVQVFLIQHGYGVSPQSAWDAAAAIGGSHFSIESLRRELDRIALAA